MTITHFILSISSQAFSDKPKAKNQFDSSPLSESLLRQKY